MVRGKETKTAALVHVAVCIIMSAVVPFAFPDGLQAVGIYKDCSVLARLAYSFFHVSLMHALVNGWCLLSIVFVYDVTLYSLAIAYITAVTFPVDTLSELLPCALPLGVPTVGLSAVCFSLLGQIAFQVKRKLYYQVWVLSFVAMGFVLPPLCSVFGCHIAKPNNILHLYCYVVGLLVGFLNSPAHA